jgi:GntR family transcriptional regulator
MAFEFTIISGGGSPIFRQLVDQVRLAVATGRISPGEPLPSVRSLAERLLVNPNTIAKAYAELSRDGVIESLPGKGAFIAPPRQMYTKAERLRRISPAVDALVNEGVSLGFTPDELVESLRQRLAKLDLSESPRRKTS